MVALCDIPIFEGILGESGRNGEITDKIGTGEHRSLSVLPEISSFRPFQWFLGQRDLLNEELEGYPKLSECKPSF